MSEPIEHPYPREMELEELNRHQAAEIARLRVAEAKLKEIEKLAEPVYELLGWTDTLEIVTGGFDAWANKPHNRRWAIKIDGTPARNGITVCVAEAVASTYRPVANLIARIGDFPKPRKAPQ